MYNPNFMLQLKSLTSSNKQSNNNFCLNNSKQSGNKSNYLNDSPSVLTNNGNNFFSVNNELEANNSDQSNLRETGIIEKLLPSYGFIQCCERQTRLFFHYSQFSGNIEHLRLGDLVEFQMLYDRRTGKPIASFVVKITSETIGEESSSERVTGFITIEVTNEREGRVAYENRGECFFLPFTKEDLEDNECELKAKDRVTFNITKDNLGNLRARHICLIESPVQGIICTLKDNFGFIERADIVKEIFFHSSECKNFKDLSLADNVEFNIQTRNNKQVAVNIEKLPPKTVIIEDIDPDQLNGQILESIERRTTNIIKNNSTLNNSINYNGIIIFRKNGKEVEIPFRERDILGGFTLNIGDLIKFQICTDKRNGIKHATNIQFCEESFNISCEKRKKGIVVSIIDENEGYIKFQNKENKFIFYRNSERLESEEKIELFSEVEFTVSSDIQGFHKNYAIRIKVLPKGTISMNFSKKLIEPYLKKETGFIVELKDNCGFIKCLNKKGNIVIFKYDTLNQNNYFNLNDEVEFYLNHSSVGGDINAIDVKKLPPGTIIKKILAESQAKNEKESNLMLKSNVENFFNLYNINVTKNTSYSKPKTYSSQIEYSSLNFDQSLIEQNTSDLNQQLSNSKNNLSQLNYENINLWSQILSVLDNNSENENSINTNLFLNNNINVSPSILKKPELTEIKDFEQSVLTIDNKNNFNNTFSNENTSNEKNCLKTLSKGIIAALKETYGFIESEDHQKEIFFHYSVFNGNIYNLNLLQEVEYSSILKNGKLSAEFVKKIPSGSINNYEILPEILTGTVLRSVRCLNPEQIEYCGLIEQKENLSDNMNILRIYEFSMVSLADIHDFVQKDDIVQFQVALMKNGQKRAVNVKPVREKYQAIVDAIKGNFGFLNYEIEEGKKLFFHMSEVKDQNVLIEGDTVEFVIVDNKRTGKFSACSVVKINDVGSQRPDRLIMKNKVQGNDELNQNKNFIARQPRRPDGTKGFNIPRKKDKSEF